MQIPKIYDKEYQFCLILWTNEPVTTSTLTQLCSERLKWAPTTTYTVIKRLAIKGVIKKEGSLVTSILGKEQVQDSRTDELLHKTFGGQFADLLLSIVRLLSR